jgi:hypothetical protein
MIEAVHFANRRAWIFLRRMAFLPFWWVVAQSAFVAFNTVANPVSLWFRPVSLYIPDHCEGTDPFVLYTREIKKPFQGSFKTYFTPIGNGSFPALRSPTIDWNYQVRPLATVRTRLSELMAIPDNRHLEVGDWFGSLDWTLNISWQRPGHATLSSNVFTVFPATDPRCL